MTGEEREQRRVRKLNGDDEPNGQMIVVWSPKDTSALHEALARLEGLRVRGMID
jgi:hypothetical protein